MARAGSHDVHRTASRSVTDPPDLTPVVHTSAVGCRTLDVLHVAAASLVGVTEFCTFDTRQGDLVRRVGMTVVSP